MPPSGPLLRRTRAPDLVSPCFGVRAPAATAGSLLERVQALTTATGAVVSHLSAAVLWGIPLPLASGDLPVVHLTSPPGRRAVRHKNVVGHEQTLEPDEMVTGAHVNCTSPLRTWFDLAGHLGLEDLVIAGDFLLRRKNPLTSVTSLDAFLAGKRGRPGYRRAMAARRLMRPNTDSPKETELRLLLTRSGLPEPGVNVPILDETGGWIQDPDLTYEREKVAIQYDGGHHAEPAQRRSDVFWDESARDAGWRAVVLTQKDLIPVFPGSEPSAVRRVRAALAERGWSPAGRRPRQPQTERPKEHPPGADDR